MAKSKVMGNNYRFMEKKCKRVEGFSRKKWFIYFYFRNSCFIYLFFFTGENALKYKTYLTQEMLKKGILASTNFYACVEHKNEYFKMYFDVLDRIYKTISGCEVGNQDINQLLEGPVCHSGFKRLN
jgi:hypothetical protein